MDLKKAVNCFGMYQVVQIIMAEIIVAEKGKN